MDVLAEHRFRAQRGAEEDRRDAACRTAGLQRYTLAAMMAAQRAAALTQRLLAFARHQPREDRAFVMRLAKSAIDPK
jgi:hypothetical protein